MSTTLRVPPAWEPHLAAYDVQLRAANRTRATREQRYYQLKRFAADHRDTELADLTHEHLLNWLAERDWSPETRRSYRAALVTFFRWAHTSGRLPENIAADLPRVTPPRALPRPAPDHVLLAGLKGKDDRARLAIEIIDAAGLRRAECAALHSDDVTTTFDGEVLRVIGKGGHEREIPIPDRIAWRIRAADGHVFPSPYGQGRHLTPHYLGKLVSAALPDHWTAHTLRHRYATRVHRACGDIRIVQELLGHASVETTMRYVGVDDMRLRLAASATWTQLAELPKAS